MFSLKGKTKKELVQLLRAYQQVINSNIICSITNERGEIIYANDAFCRISKYSREELLGQNHRLVNSGYHPKAFFKELWETISSGRAWYGEIKSKAKDGTFFWQNSAITPILDENGRIKEYFSLRIPIDDKKKIEEERKEYIGSLEEMLFMTSHKVRQPITQILGIADVLNTTKTTVEELQQLANYMKQSALTLDIFTRELTAFMEGLGEKVKEK